MDGIFGREGPWDGELGEEVGSFKGKFGGRMGEKEKIKNTNPPCGTHQGG